MHGVADVADVAGVTPTARSLKYLRDMGIRAGIVEKWNKFARVRQDLFGVLDIVALDTARGVTLGIQCTSDAHVAERVRKIQEAGVVGELEHCGWEVWVWGWGKKGERGKRKLWTRREVRVRASNVPEG